MIDVGMFVNGSPESSRQPVRWWDLLNAYANCDIETGHECFLSHFIYGPEMLIHYKANRRSVAGFAGPTWARWIVFDIDRSNLEEALTDSRKLTGSLLQRYPQLDGTIPIYFSGNKGFHVYLELCHEPPPAVGFNDICRTLAEGLARDAGVRIDSAIYDANRILRLPNSQHPKSGLFKRRIDVDALLRLDLAGILEMAKQPSPDGIPTVADRFPEIEKDWQDAKAETLRKAEGRALVRKAATEGDIRAPKYLLEFLRGVVKEGERRPTLFRCAAWMAEQGAPDRLVFALLDEAARDLGIMPKDVTRQIRCGIDHARKQSEGGPRV